MLRSLAVRWCADATGSLHNDLLTGDGGIVSVSADYGLGTSLVSGEADADTYRVDRAGAIVEQQQAVLVACVRACARPLVAGDPAVDVSCMWNAP